MCDDEAIKVFESPSVVVVDTAFPAQDFSLLETPSQVKKAAASGGSQLPSTPSGSIVDPDHYVFKLKFEKSDKFIEVVVSHLTRFLDLPGSELESMRASVKFDQKPGTNRLAKRPWAFMKKKDVKGTIFGANLTEQSLIQIQSLTEFLSANLGVEGIFRKPGNSHRIAQLRAALNTGVCIDLESSKFHSHDVATVLKTYLGELPEPLLQHKFFKAHLQIADMMSFDIKGNKTNLPDKAKRIEALQLLLLLLPTVNRTLLRGILDLLYQTAKQQSSNKMNASNLATMFCPHLLWPRTLKTADLQHNIGKLNEHMAFMIRHSQKIFAAPQYVRDTTRAEYGALPTPSSEYRSVICTPSGAIKRTSSGRNEYNTEATKTYTEKALQELFEQVNSMPNSAKKKKIVKNMEKYTQARTPSNKRHKRSRTFGGMIKKKVLSVATPSEKVGSDGCEKDKHNYVHIPQPGSGTLLRGRSVADGSKSASGKKPKSRPSIKDTIFRRSMKDTRRSSDTFEESSSSDALSPIPFPSLTDGNEKENKVTTV